MTKDIKTIAKSFIAALPFDTLDPASKPMVIK